MWRCRVSARSKKMEKLEGKNRMKTCYLCKGKIEAKKIDHVHHWKGKMYFFKNLKAEVCTQCGEVFLLPEAIRFMDQTVQNPGKVETTVQIPVFTAPEFMKEVHP